MSANLLQVEVNRALPTPGGGRQIVRKMLVFVALAFLGTVSFVKADETQARVLLEQVILADDAARPALFDQIAGTGELVASVVLTAWKQGEILIEETPQGEKIPFLKVDGKSIRVSTGQPIATANSKALDSDRKLRKTIQRTVDLLSVADPSPAARADAIQKIGMNQLPEYLPVLEKRLEIEKDGSVKKSLHVAIAMLQISSPDQATKIAAIQQLGKLSSLASRDALKKLEKDPDPKVAEAASVSLKQIQNYAAGVDFASTIFGGFSNGSILLVAALGLAITFGLMGVINMAHGEIIVVGAYTTYVVQCIFGKGLFLPFFGASINIPGFGFEGPIYESYFVFAIPISFITAALIGILLERCIIRFMYSRPLESLLATWGVSQVLQQMFRLIFGSNNVSVSSPSWLSGSYVISDVSLGYNRMFVIGFAAAIVLGVWLLLTKTPLGLLIRAVMQDRSMASCMGVRTERVNMMTFALGSGLAGLAGAFLSQLGNVGPELGQTYIVNCFMTVVVGGVGNLVGTIYSALGIGVFDSALQPFLGPVMGKISVLMAIILFLQWKPGGLFPTRTRSLDG